MKSWVKVLIIFVVSVLLIGGSLIGYNYLKDNINLNTSGAATGGQKAKDFTVINKNGNKVKLSSFYGKPVVLNFWASWCGPCKAEMPHFQEVYNDMGNDITFITVNLTDGYRETMKSAKDYIAAQGYTFPVYFDTEQEAADAYSITSIPTTYFINSEGKIVDQFSGPMSKEVLLQKISSIK